MSGDLFYVGHRDQTGVSSLVRCHPPLLLILRGMDEWMNGWMDEWMNKRMKNSCMNE